MIRAYNELYLSDAQRVLASALDYALNDCKQDPDLFAKYFVRSKVCGEFERGNPAILSGIAGVEMAQMVQQSVSPSYSFSSAVQIDAKTELGRSILERGMMHIPSRCDTTKGAFPSAMVMPNGFPVASFSQERSAAYWAGWSLAYYQWYTTKRFKNIFSRIPLSEILLMYKVYHEMDLSNFVADMDERYNRVVMETKLKTIRESRGLTQAELAALSGVTKRSIQLYEQKVNDIDKAQAQTLYKLSRVLGCTIEDLLENPESTE